MQFYIYVLLDLRKIGKFKYREYCFQYEPFYIGISKRKVRVNEHFYLSTKTCNALKTGIIKKLLKLSFNKNNIVSIYKNNLTESDAIKLEIDMIKTIGRRSFLKVPLSNMTDGGGGIFNPDEEWRREKGENSKGEKNIFYGKKHSKETKEKMSNAKKGKQKGCLNGNFGKKWTTEQKNVASIRQKKNHKHLIGENNPSKRTEVKKKISKSKMGIKNPNASIWELVSPAGEKHTIKGGVKRKLKNLGLTYSMFVKIDEITKIGYKKGKASNWVLIKKTK